jgi:hypothetical protein
VPRLCLSNGFDFPTIPNDVKVAVHVKINFKIKLVLNRSKLFSSYYQDLSPLEERLVALRLPFMQIRLMGTEQQSTLRENVVNVENDLDICAQVLPRKFDETSTVQVQLMRRMK